MVVDDPAINQHSSKQVSQKVLFKKKKMQVKYKVMKPPIDQNFKINKLAYQKNL